MPWELTGNAGTHPNVDFVGTTDSQALAVRTNNVEHLRIDTVGNVGIGTANPTSRLEIIAQDALLISGYQPFLTLSDSSGGSKRARIQNANGDINFFTEPSFATGIPPMKIENSGTVQILTQDALQIVGYQPFLTLSDSSSGYKRARIQHANGDINFFTEPTFATGIPPMKIQNSGTVQILTQDALQIVGYQPFLTLSDSNSGYKGARIQNANGDINFFTEPSPGAFVPAMIIQHSGDVAIGSNLSVAQDIRLTGADCAEDFDIAGSKNSEPGTVMVINEEGSLEPSRHAYDKKVAGVVSGAGEHKAGIILDKQQSNSKRLPIALVGKVHCKVDAQYSPIEVGDLLTTSATPGHAMKAEDPLKAFGSVIGKALRPLREGQALIPMLIALQ
jgi:hypothetical protein